MGEPALKERVSNLEMAMMELAYESMKTDMAVKQLANEMKDFKNEMKDFKDEMKDFKDEMLLFKDGVEDFKNEMKDFKDEMKDFKDEMKDFKDEMKDFKDEMLLFKDGVEDFKDEMSDFKNEMKDFKNEMKDFKTNSEADRKSMNKKWGELANKMGTIVEDIVAPSVEGIVREYFKINELDMLAIRFRKRSSDGKSIREFDVIAESKNYFFIVETKATPRTEYVKDFIKLISEIEKWFPNIKDKKIIPIFSSLYLPEDTIKYLTNNNIFAMAMKDDNMDILNYDELENSISV